LRINRLAGLSRQSFTVLLMVLLAGASTPLDGSGKSKVTATASVDTTDYLIGDWIDVRVRLKHPVGTVFTPPAPDTLGRFTVLKASPIRRVSDGESTTSFRIALYDTGRVAVPPIHFLYRLPGDTAKYQVATQAVDLTVHAVPVDSTGDIKDIKPPLTPAYDWKEIATWLGLGILIAGIVVLIIRYLRRRKKVPGQSAGPIEERPAHVVAMERLRAIEAERLWQKGHRKRYYTEVTEVIRAYLERRFGVPALEMTTPDILRLPVAEAMPAEVRDMLSSMLSLADLVKFAKYRSMPEEDRRLMEEGYSFVEATAEAPREKGEEDPAEAEAGVRA